MKHIWWATIIITIWLAIGGWVALRVTDHPSLATSVAGSGAGLTSCCGALLICGLFSGKLDD